MFDATIDDRTRHRSVPVTVGTPIASAPVVFVGRYQPASISRLQPASAHQSSQQQ